MTKRTRKPAKKREQPWMAAAREKLRRKVTPEDAPTTDEPPETARSNNLEEVALALIELARPDLDALGDALTEADADRLIGRAVQVYNKPLFDVLPAGGEGGSPGAMMGKVLEIAFERIPGLRERFARMLAIRTTRFVHLRQPILNCNVTFDDRNRLSIALELLSQHDTERLQEHLLTAAPE